MAVSEANTVARPRAIVNMDTFKTSGWPENRLSKKTREIFSEQADRVLCELVRKVFWFAQTSSGSAKPVSLLHENAVRWAVQSYVGANEEAVLEFQAMANLLLDAGTGKLAVPDEAGEAGETKEDDEEEEEDEEEEAKEGEEAKKPSFSNRRAARYFAWQKIGCVRISIVLRRIKEVFEELKKEHGLSKISTSANAKAAFVAACNVFVSAWILESSRACIANKKKTIFPVHVKIATQAASVRPWAQTFAIVVDADSDEEESSDEAAVTTAAPPTAVVPRKKKQPVAADAAAADAAAAAAGGGEPKAPRKKPADAAAAAGTKRARGSAAEGGATAKTTSSKRRIKATE